ASGILSYVSILVPSFIISPGLIQKLYGARDARAVRIGINWNAAGLVLFAFAPAILGIVARSQYPNLSNRELALPMVMTKLMPGWLGLLTLAAVFSAEISASDAILFMLSSSLSVDLYKTFLRPRASDRDLLLAGRLAAVAGAFFGVLFAIALPSTISALQIFYTLMAVALSAPLLIGLYSRRPTGCTVILCERGVVAGVDVRGSAPGTRETDLLKPINTVDKVNAIVLSGGSAFGLDTATGVMRYLEEHDSGFQTAAGKVPIVPAAILYDLTVGDGKIRPNADAGYKACTSSKSGPIDEGSVGAGAGATDGKLTGGK